jgi:acyl dehydratase
VPMPVQIEDGTIHVRPNGERRRQSTRAVSDRWLVAYAASVGDTRPELFDVERPGGIVGHPVFPACIEWPLVADGAPGIELTAATLNRGLHVAQSSVLHAPIVPGGKLTTEAELVVAEQRTNAAHIATEFTTVDETGVCVAVTRTHMLYPGVRVHRQGQHLLEQRTRQVRQVALAPVGSFEVTRTNAVIYTECAQIWNPIHTDPRVAKAAGLPGPVLHGTETLARALTAITSAYGWPAAAVSSYSCRFTAPVIAGHKLLVRASEPHQSEVAFDVVTEHGTTVVSDGIVQRLLSADQ